MSHATPKGPVRVVVVDDRHDVLSAVRRACAGSKDITIVGETSSGAAAIDLVDRIQPDVIVMDLNMAVLDGLEATLAIKTRHSDIAIVTFSWDTSPTSGANSHAVGERPDVGSLVDQIRRLASATRRELL